MFKFWWFSYFAYLKFLLSIYKVFYFKNKFSQSYLPAETLKLENICCKLKTFCKVELNEFEENIFW